MRTLAKRWRPVRNIKFRRANVFTWFLADAGYAPDEDYFNWACVESKGSKDGPYRLEIWNMDEKDWDTITYFNTLKEAKAVGRILAAAALRKNF